MSCNLNNLLSGDSCSKNTAGAKPFFYCIPVDEIVTEPARLATDNPGDSMRLDGGYTLVTTAGKGYWRKYELLPGTHFVKDTPVGIIGSVGFETRAGGTIKGYSAVQKEAWANISNQPLVIISPDKNGEYHVTGTKEDPAYLEPSGGGGTGATSGDQRAIAITLIATSSDPAPSYDADTNALNTTPAS